MFLANCRPAKNDFTILLFHHIINLKIVPLVQFVCAMRRKLWSTGWEVDSHLGTGHYLSPGGAEDFMEDYLIFRKTKGGISRNWELKRGDRWKLWKDSEGVPLKVGWKMKTCGGGSRKSSKVIRGDHFSEVLKHSKGGSAKCYPLLSPKSSSLKSERGSALLWPVKLTILVQINTVWLPFLLYREFIISLHTTLRDTFMGKKY